MRITSSRALVLSRLDGVADDNVIASAIIPFHATAINHHKGVSIGVRGGKA
jgi:hypothetical protein